MFNIFLRMKIDTSESNLAMWPVMRVHRTKEIYIGHIWEQYPTYFTKRTLGAAVAAIYKKMGSQISRLEVKEAIDYCQEQEANDSGGERGSPGYSEACGVWN